MLMLVRLKQEFHQESGRQQLNIVKIEPPLKPKEIPINAAAIYPAISIYWFDTKLQTDALANCDHYHRV